MPGRPVISNCRAPTEKVSGLFEFLDHHLKPIMQNGLSYIRDSKFFRKNKNYWKCSWKCHSCHCWCSGYPNIPHHAGLKALKEALEKRDIKKILAEDLLKMAEFVLNNKNTYLVKIHRYFFYLDSWWTSTRKVFEGFKQFYS